METVPKPDELLALHTVTEELFDKLRQWFDVPDKVTLDLTHIDAAVTEMSDPQKIAALAMRKLQALHLLAMPGVRTTTDTVVTIVQDLDRALVQAPSMYLSRQAASTDWDAELAAMAAGPADDGGAETGGDAGALADGPPPDEDDEDPEITAFRGLHGCLHKAVYAVVEASGGEIRYLE